MNKAQRKSLKKKKRQQKIENKKHQVFVEKKLPMIRRFAEMRVRRKMFKKAHSAATEAQKEETEMMLKKALGIPLSEKVPLDTMVKAVNLKLTQARAQRKKEGWVGKVKWWYENLRAWFKARKMVKDARRGLIHK